MLLPGKTRQSKVVAISVRNSGSNQEPKPFREWLFQFPIFHYWVRIYHYGENFNSIPFFWRPLPKRLLIPDYTGSGLRIRIDILKLPILIPDPDLCLKVNPNFICKSRLTKIWNFAHWVINKSAARKGLFFPCLQKILENQVSKNNLRSTKTIWGQQKTIRGYRIEVNNHDSCPWNF